MLTVCICKVNELILMDSPQSPRPLIRNQYNLWGARKSLHHPRTWSCQKKKGKCGWWSQEHVVWVDQEKLWWCPLCLQLRSESQLRRQRLSSLIKPFLSTYRPCVWQVDCKTYETVLGYIYFSLICSPNCSSLVSINPDCLYTGSKEADQVGTPSPIVAVILVQKESNI